MSMRFNKLSTPSVIIVLTLWLFSSCSYEKSNVTGWNYNDPKSGGFQKVPYVEQETGPGLVLIEGGRYTMGRKEQDVTYENDNRPRNVTVSSFYLDETEVTNFNWLEYLYWLRRTYTQFGGVWTQALPDTNCWRKKMAFLEPKVLYYLRHPAYRDYPVVGISWLQANDFCKWRTDRVNEYILIREGLLEQNVNQKNDPFVTESYLYGKYEPSTEDNYLPDLNPDKAAGGEKYGKRIARMEDGYLLPRYRLPTEAEWEFAYYGLIGNLDDPKSENMSDNRIYAWNGHYVRMDDKKNQGRIRANFVRDRGDFMGIAGNLNDRADITAPVNAYWPNDYGLYNMAGNVSEWCMDVYRVQSSEEVFGLQPFRGNVFMTKVQNTEGGIDDKNMINLYDVHGIKEYLLEFERVRYSRLKAKDEQIDTANYNTDNMEQRRMFQQVEAANVLDEDQFHTSLTPDEKWVWEDKPQWIDTLERDVLRRVNLAVDSAISLKNQRYDIEASTLIEDIVLNEILIEEFIRIGPDEEYPVEIIPMIREAISDYIINTPGRLKWREVVAEENIRRRNYKNSDYRNYLDGDVESSVYYADNDGVKSQINEGKYDEDLVMYQDKYQQTYLDGNAHKPNKYGWPTTLISDKARVYKGGSWADRAYYIHGGARRFLDEDLNDCTIGFRCAMTRVGSPRGLGKKINQKK